MGNDGTATTWSWRSVASLSRRHVGASSARIGPEEPQHRERGVERRPSRRREGQAPPQRVPGLLAAVELQERVAPRALQERFEQFDADVLVAVSQDRVGLGQGVVRRASDHIQLPAKASTSNKPNRVPSCSYAARAPAYR